MCACVIRLMSIIVMMLTTGGYDVRGVAVMVMTTLVVMT